MLWSKNKYKRLEMGCDIYKSVLVLIEKKCIKKFLKDLV